MLAFVSLISFIGLVFVPPAVMFLIAAGQIRGDGVSRLRSIAVVLIAVMLGAVAFFALFAREDLVCWAKEPRDGRIVPPEPRPVRAWLVDLDG